MAFKSTFAFVIALAALVGVMALWRSRRSLGSGLLLGAACCFVVVASAHLFEAFSLLPRAGWGQPHSVGHYIDFGAAVLSAGLLVAAIMGMLFRRARN